MKRLQEIAFIHPCRFAFETMHPRFRSTDIGLSIILTVNHGYECIDLGFGGSVWHASVSHSDRGVRRNIARKVLMGVGDKNLGEWEQDNNHVYHIRRRLKIIEEKTVGGVADLRGTIEEKKRAGRFLSSISNHPMYAVFEMAINEELSQ